MNYIDKAKGDYNLRRNPPNHPTLKTLTPSWHPGHVAKSRFVSKLCQNIEKKREPSIKINRVLCLRKWTTIF